MKKAVADSGERWSSLFGLFLVLVFHGGLLYSAWSYRLLPAPQEAMTLLVNLINPPPVEKKPDPPPPPPKPVKLVKKMEIHMPPQTMLVSNAPVTSPAEPVAAPPPEPVVQAPPGPPAPEPAVAPPVPAGPVLLTSDLALACPQRVAPEYPLKARRQGEQGKVLLRVELDENGRVASARVQETSGYKRLDDAGLEAIKQWQCNAPLRNGVAVRAIALQPFNFILEGRK